MDKTGGPAFPIALKDEGHPTPLAPGMNLRDWFAGMALQGIVKSLEDDFQKDKQHSAPAQFFAIAAYAIADALLTQREAK